MLNVGVLKEIKNFEGRVGLCPKGVADLVETGIDVFVEGSAGEGCGFSDALYTNAGATVVPSAEKLVKKSDILVKVQPISKAESELIDGSHMVFSLLNLGSKGERLKSLVDSNTINFGADLVEDDKSTYPVLEALSEVSGRMAVHVGANLLSVSHGGKGILISGADVIPPANVTIVGSGLIGRVAAIQAWTNGANVNLLSLKPENIENYERVRDGLSIKEYSEQDLKKLLPQTDILIVSVYSLKNPDFKVFISKNTINYLKPGSVIIDLSVEQSQIIETSHVTSLAQPTYIADGIIYYCVPNIAATVPLTSSQIYTKKLLPFIEILAKNGLKKALDKSPELLSGLATYKGKITNRILANRFKYSFHNIFDLLELNL